MGVSLLGWLRCSRSTIVSIVSIVSMLDRRLPRARGRLTCTARRAPLVPIA
jgi:hypothetical protein